VIAGGDTNSITGYSSSIGGGARNSIVGNYSAIPGGQFLKLGDNSFGFGVSSSLTDISANANTAYFGDVNLWLGNVDGSARKLQFFSPNSSLTYTGAKYSSFQAGSQTANIEYTLPLAMPIAGQVLTATPGTAPAVALSWTTPTSGGAAGWLLTGNSATTSGTNYLGTNDNQAFEIHVDNSATSTGGNHRVMRYEEGTTSPNIIGGSSANSIATGLSGAAILSGGSIAAPNVVSDTFSVIVGGRGNIIQGPFSTIAGGDTNVIDSAAKYSFIGGGHLNRLQGLYNVIAGGDTNEILYGTYADTLLPNDHTFIGGGQGNIAYGQFDMIGGGRGNIMHVDQFRSGLNVIAGGDSNIVGWGCYGNVIAGGKNNITANAYGSIGGGFANVLNGPGGLNVIGGGAYNEVGGDTVVNAGAIQASVISGGDSNIIRQYANFSTIGGGTDNLIDSATNYSTIAGGLQDSISGPRSFIGGGCFNKVLATEWGTIAGGCGNKITDTLAFIGGGQDNKISGFLGTVAGGELNTVSSFTGTIGGGDSNTISAIGGFIGGGYANTVKGGNGSIAGGQLNTVGANFGSIGGGDSNIVSGASGRIGGGQFNVASALMSTVGGGDSNHAQTTRSTIGGGLNNFIKSNGTLAAIPGGDHLIAQSYAQFVTGAYNIAQGISSPGSIVGDDFLAIFGNGTNASNRSDAFEISYDGHAIVHDNNGSLSNAPFRTPFYGATYQDNTIVAWGDIPVPVAPGTAAPFNSTADFGVKKIFNPHIGLYVVCLQTKNPTAPGTYYSFKNASITATLEDLDTNYNDSAAVCGTITVSRLGITYPLAPPDTYCFLVRIANNCSPADRPFYFKVCARP
jgi:hypothetical protein